MLACLLDTLDYVIKKDSQIIYSFSVINDVTSSGIKLFFAYKDKWILEYTNNVLVDGEDICEQNDYSKAFSSDSILLYVFQDLSSVSI